MLGQKKLLVVRELPFLQEKILAVGHIFVSIMNFTRTNVKWLAYTMLSPENCGKNRGRKKKVEAAED